MKLEPYWWEAAPPRKLPKCPVEAACDAVVIGGGYAGLHAALELASVGRSVQLFDKEGPGYGGSSRNGGIVSGTTKFKLSELIDTLGLETAKALFQEGIDAENWLRRFIKDQKIACKYTRAGRFVGAYRPRDYDLLARDAEAINKHFDRGVRVVPKSAQHMEIGTDFYHGGISTDGVCGLHPALYHAGLLDRALDAGVTVHGECAVLGFRREGDRTEVKTARGTIRTRDLVVATNAYTDKNLPWLRRRLIPAASQMSIPAKYGAIDHQLPKPSSRWTEGWSCTNIQTGPVKWG